MACVLAVGLLCVFPAQGQVIEEGGFPVKGEGVSGEPFSLSCPSRLVAEAGGSVPVLCTATSVPEEGVRYEWESASGDGLRFLSDAQILSPLFTTPVSGADPEYAYRLTATGPGVYATASVTIAVEGVSVQGVSGQSAGAAATGEECDPFMLPGGLGEGCLEDTGAVPFGFSPEEEFPFPDGSGRPGQSGQPGAPDPGGGFESRTPPRLECPAAVFLEELETGAIECHAWDASGEEYLEYAWEPVGSTTRDYMNNPRLLPEDSPTPSIVAPETPAYETLERETTFRYRYRLTATSRATGLSSSSEVEVYVSSSRPGVYCPLEVVVAESETVSLNCEGVDPLSFRMGYDEEAASVLWEWEGLWGTSTDPLDATDLFSPLFTAPPGSAGKEYHYIASMTSSASGASRTARRKVTVRVAGVEQPADDARATAKDRQDVTVTCKGNPYEVNDDDDDFTLNCSAAGAPEGVEYDYVWTKRGSTSTTNKLSSTTISSPKFSVPDHLFSDMTFEYMLTASAENAGSDSVDVTVKVYRTTGTLNAYCWSPDVPYVQGNVPFYTTVVYYTYEGAEDFDMLCADASRSTEGPFVWKWRAVDTHGTGTALLSVTDKDRVTFSVPESVDSNPTEYEYSVEIYKLGVSSDIDPVTVVVQKRPSISVVCNSGDPYEVDENSPDFLINCSATGAPEASTYNYVWTVRDDTPDTDNLSSTAVAQPTFDVPYDVDTDTDYEYLLTVTADKAIADSASVTVTVKDTGVPDAAVTCTDPDPVYEATADFTLDCSVTDEPTDATYSWTANTVGAPSLTGDTDTLTPTFDVPGNVDMDTDYEYAVTLSASGVDDVTENMTVTVLEKPDIFCGQIYSGQSFTYEGSPDYTPFSGCPSGWEGAPAGSDYMFEWTARGDTPDTDRLSATDIEFPMFDVPETVDEDETYSYTLTVSAENADDYLQQATVTVWNKQVIVIACDDNPYEVNEGDADIALECEADGAPGTQPDYMWSWSPIANLTGHDTANPTFDVPDVDKDTTWTYTVTASAANADDGTATVTVTVKNTDPAEPSLACTDSEAYEATADFTLNCSVANEPSGATYAWTARGGTLDTDDLSTTTVLQPTFFVPDNVDADTEYEYSVTMSASGANGSISIVRLVTITVKNKPRIAVDCDGVSGLEYQGNFEVDEGDDDITLNCSATGAPGGSVYGYAWTPLGDTQDTSLLSAADILSPTFYVPDAVDRYTEYTYTLTVTAANAEDGAGNVIVRVYDTDSPAPVVACLDVEIYEATLDFTLNCSVANEPFGATYAWTARGNTSDTDALSSTTVLQPTFFAPDNVDADTEYEYRVAMSTPGISDVTEDVIVTVLNKPPLDVVCATPSPVYEGAADFDLDCVASGAPAGSGYVYAWTGRGSTEGTDRLSSTTVAKPTFDVSEEVDGDETYEYLLTVSAENAESGSAELTVKVLNLGSIALVCASSPLVYEGSEDFALDCSILGDTGGADYAYKWSSRGSTLDTDRLSATDIASPTFLVPDDVAATTTYEYLLTASAEDAAPATVEVTVTVLDKPALAVICADPGPIYEGAADIIFDCEASGAPDGSDYAYAWTATGNTLDTSLLSATDVASPTFHVPDQVDADETYTYRLTVSTSAGNTNPGAFDLTITVYDSEDLVVVCIDRTVYEGSPPFRMECTASGGPPGVLHEWDWSPDTHLTGSRIRTPVFTAPSDVDSDMIFTYTATVTAGSMVATGALTVTVLNKPALAVVCADPGSVYEGSEDIAFDCSASGAPGDNPQYVYIWAASGDTPDTALLSATDIASPTFYVPDEVDENETYEYLLTVSAENAEDATAEVAVTVLDKPALAVVCADPGSVYEGSEDLALDCDASGAPGDSPQYVYVWAASGDTQDTSLLSATYIASPTFYVPNEVDEHETYEYLLTVSAENVEDATAEVTVTVLDRVETPEPEPVTPPVASSAREPSEPSSLGVTVSASALRFGVQSADTEASLDPVTDLLSTYVSGPYHAGRVTLSAGGAEFDENGEMDLSIELLSPVALRRADGVEADTLVLAPSWSFAESCEQLSSQTLGGLYTEVTLSETDCRLLRFGGELDLSGVSSGRYAGAMDIVLRSGENEETFAVEVSVTVVPAQRVITIGPGGVRFDTSREIPAGLTEEQNLSIYPEMAFLTEGKPDGSFELSNPSLIPLEVSVSARFGYTEATEVGREVVVENIEDSDLGDLSAMVDIHPGVLILQPGEKGLIRYGVSSEALSAMEEKGYAAFFDMVSEPRQYVRSDRMPEEVSGDRTARVTMRVPGVYVPGEGASQLSATLLSVSYVGSLSATFLLEAGDGPFVGEVVAYDGEGRELGRRETLVYTRSRVRIPLDRMPEEETVFLRFLPRGSDRVPAPASVEWNAPGSDTGRDIGAAGGTVRPMPPATLGRKP